MWIRSRFCKGADSGWLPGLDSDAADPAVSFAVNLQGLALERREQLGDGPNAAVGIV